MNAVDFYLPGNASLLFVGYRPGQSVRELDAAERGVRNAVRGTSFSFLNPQRAYSDDELAAQLGKARPSVLHLWLPSADLRTKAASQVPVSSSEIGAAISKSAPDLSLLFVQNAADHGWREEVFSSWAPVVIWAVAPMQPEAWAAFVEQFLRVLSANLPIREAFQRAIEGSMTDFPEIIEFVRIEENERLERERLLGEPPSEEEPEAAEEAETEPNAIDSPAPPETPGEPSSQATRLHSLAGGAHSDLPTEAEEKDWLGYKAYAQIIAQIIKDPKTEPPLSIAVIGPWGQGKSSLMRMVQRRVREEPLRKEEETRSATAGEITRWAAQNEKEAKPRKLSFPTVWFNPWEYQSSEQIWSGMAHAIIHQLVEKLPKLEQEKFWLRLHLQRIDRQAIRQRLYRDIFLRVLPFGMALVLALVLGVVMWANQQWGWGLLSIGVLGLPSLAGSLVTAARQWKSGTEELYKEFLKPPDYNKHLGVYHEVNQDLERVFSLLVDKAAVVFIDDLDRCSPYKVVEVIEAINLMMNAHFRSQCYFVIGMDAEMVAAALDVQYHGMKGKFPGKEKNLGSVGWYFLDKFIQVPIVLPTMSEPEKLDFLGNLFGRSGSQPASPSSGKDLGELQQKARTILSQARDGLTEEVAKVRQEVSSSGMEEILDQEILAKAYSESEDAKDIVEQVKAFATYLDPSPRSIKRFANLLRFYTAQQQLRATKSLPSADTEALAKWLLITLRWPMLVRWLQWREDQGLNRWTSPDRTDRTWVVQSQRPEAKAQALDKLVDDFRLEQQLDPDDQLVFWQDLAEANPELPWLGDPDLIRLLTHQHREADRLVHALECGVW